MCPIFAAVTNKIKWTEMEKTSIQYIKEAAKKLMHSKLQRLGAPKTQEIFQGVMHTVGLESMEEVYLFVPYFDCTCKDDPSNLDNLTSYFECSSLDLIEYVPALKSLAGKGILVRCYGKENNIIKQNFCVSDIVMTAVIENRPVPLGKLKVEEVKIDKYDFCEQIGEKTEDDGVTTNVLVSYTESMERANAHLSFVKEVKKQVKKTLDRILFYDMCYDDFREDGIGHSNISTTMKDIYTNMGERILAKRSIKEEKNTLIQLGLIEIDYGNDDHICLSPKGKALFYGEDMEAFSKSYRCRDIYGFMDKVKETFHDKSEYDCDKIDFVFINDLMEELEKQNQHIPEVGNIAKQIHNSRERVLFYCIGSNMVDGCATSLTDEIRTLYPRHMRKDALNDYKEKVNFLQQEDLVKLEKCSWMMGEETNLTLTDKGKETLLGEDAVLYIHEVSNEQLISCDKIAEKKLFFANGLEQQLSLLRDSLSESHYKALCARLDENHLPKGMAVLFYGEPGTGKTESVMQIAKATGRAIMHVDISATKTCWFGESEKLIKQVFTDYKKLCDKSKVKPILLFNEADAVFSKRKDVGQGSCDQTENAIQNIILEEMENLDGILIATTNLPDNLDGAFERRFLFKIRFDRPTVEAKTNIWMNKLPRLTTEEAQTLASSYEFSGGQIDNIVRKALMQEVIKGEQPTLQALQAMCSEEKIAKGGSKRIGFC